MGHLLYLSSRRKTGLVIETHHNSCLLAGADWLCLGSGQGKEAGEIELRADGVVRDHAILAWDGNAWVLQSANGSVFLEKGGRRSPMKTGGELLSRSSLQEKRLCIGDRCVISVSSCGLEAEGPVCLKMRVLTPHHRFFPEEGPTESIIVAPARSVINLLEAVEGLPGDPAQMGTLESESEGKWSFRTAMWRAKAYPGANRIELDQSVPIKPRDTIVIHGPEETTYDLFCDDPEFQLSRRVTTFPGRDQMPYLLPGTIVDGYMLMARLGEGVCGAAWLAREVGPGAQTGLRVIKFIWRDHERELQAWRQLQNDNAHGLPRVLQVVDMGEGVGYVVLFYTPGRDLAATLAMRKIGPWEFLHMVWDVASGGLAPLHAAGYIHGDIKPGNILLLDDGHAQLLDFGGLGHAEAKRRQFSKHYVPPEVKADPAGVPMRPEQDVFAFATMLNEMLGRGEEPAAWDLLGAGDGSGARLSPRVRHSLLLYALLWPAILRGTASSIRRRYRHAGEMFRGVRRSLITIPLAVIVPLLLLAMFLFQAETRRGELASRLARISRRTTSLEETLTSAVSLSTVREDYRASRLPVRAYMRLWGVPDDMEALAGKLKALSRDQMRLLVDEIVWSQSLDPEQKIERLSAEVEPCRERAVHYAGLTAAEADKLIREAKAQISGEASRLMRRLVAELVDDGDLEPEEKMALLRKDVERRVRNAVEYAGLSATEADALIDGAVAKIEEEARRRRTLTLRFPDAESVSYWKPIQDWEMNRQDKAVRSLGHHIADGEGVLRLRVEMNPSSPNEHEGKGEAAVDLRKLPFVGLQVPVNMRDCKISVEFVVDGKLEGPPERPNGIQVLAIDSDWHRYYGTWTPLKSDKSWAYCQTTLSAEAPIGGWVDPAFNPSRILYLGIKVGTSPDATEMASGYVLIRSYTFDVRPQKPKAPQPATPPEEKRTPAAEPAPERKPGKPAGKKKTGKAAEQETAEKATPLAEPK